MQIIEYLDDQLFEAEVIQLKVKKVKIATICKVKICLICHYLFFNHGFKFWDYVRDGCHDFGNAVSQH